MPQKNTLSNIPLNIADSPTQPHCQEGVCKKQPGRKGVFCVDNVGQMREECTSWPAMLAEAEKRIIAYHEADPSSRKFPAPLVYGVRDGPTMFGLDEEGIGEGIIRIVDDEVARQIDENGGEDGLFDDL